MTSSSRKILISGASGMIGSFLIRAAEANRIQALRLVRNQPRNPSEIRWHPDSDPPLADPGAIDGLDAAIHLSGANLSSHPWTPAYKREIVDSRVTTTRSLVKLLKSLRHPPPVFVCASATGIYGNRVGEVLTEASFPGQGFLAETCLAWEEETAPARSAGMRVLNARFGVVLAREGGALKKMLPIFRWGLGGPLGSGRQWMSWIALDDLVRALFYLLDATAIDGPINLVAPNPVTNAEFTRALAKALRRPAILPVPSFALRLGFGEMADDALLASTRAIPHRLLRSGFVFDLPEIASALKAILLSP